MSLLISAGFMDVFEELLAKWNVVAGMCANSLAAIARFGGLDGVRDEGWLAQPFFPNFRG